MVIGHLRVLDMKEPLGIDIAPAFSWELHEGDPNTLQKRTASSCASNQRATLFGTAEP